jgi:hypothetical protein
MLIMTVLKLKYQKDNDAGCKRNAKPKNVDCSMFAVVQKISESSFKISSDHCPLIYATESTAVPLLKPLPVNTLKDKKTKSVRKRTVCV